jgi:beta-lactamase regulating signal transducer with metallopeptidase domain
MLTAVFSHLVTGTVLSLVLIPLVLLLRPVTVKWFSKSWNYYIWLLIIGAMLIPVRVPLFNIAPLRVTADTVKGAIGETPTVGLTSTPFNRTYATAEPQGVKTVRNPRVLPASEIRTQLDNAQPEIKPDNAFIETLKRIPPLMLEYLPIVWLAGAVSLVLYKIIDYRRFIKLLRKYAHSFQPAEWTGVSAYPVRGVPDEILSSPIAAGIFKPAIYLPDIEWNHNEFEMALSHETTHVKRKDILYKLLVQGLLCIYWFNPLVYLLRNDMERYCELSCDDVSTSAMDAEKKLSYIRTVLSLVKKSQFKPNPLTSGMRASGRELERRVKALLYARKTSLPVKIGAVITAVALFAGCGALSSAVNTPAPSMPAVDMSVGVESGAEPVPIKWGSDYSYPGFVIPKDAKVQLWLNEKFNIELDTRLREGIGPINTQIFDGNAGKQVYALGSNAMVDYADNRTKDLIIPPYKEDVTGDILNRNADFYNNHVKFTINGIVNEFFLSVINGTADVDRDWDSYIAKLNEAGLAEWRTIIDTYPTVSE